MTNDISIFGAGLSGLIAARMLAEQCPTVYELKEDVPNNHKAVLRFRSSIVGDVTNIPFKAVNVIKGVHQSANAVADAVGYSLKVSGRLEDRSVLNLEPARRYVAPTDFIARLASTADIQFGVDFEKWSHNLTRLHGPIISTLPMPYMMDLFKWEHKPEFRSREGWTARGTIREQYASTMNATLYNPGKGSWYRATINGPDLIIEGMGLNYDNPLEILRALNLSYTMLEGNDERRLTCHPAKYQKISDLTPDEAESAKRFVMWLSEEHGIYSLGRFALWRPKLLLDDVVNDVRVIRRLIAGESRWADKVGKR